MSHLHLNIGDIVLTGGADRSEGAALEGVLRKALQTLAEQLSARPGWNQADLAGVIVDRLETTPLTVDQLLQPGGPELLADALLDAILSEVR
ncbi:MAG: hypothetical protein AAFV53_11645 [Myxococcota bacterium]